MAHLLSHEAFEKLPVMAFTNLMGSPPAGYNELQRTLLPYAHAIEGFWWSLFFMIALYWAWRVLAPVFFPGGGVAPQVMPATGWKARYARVSGLEEIAQDPLLRWFGGAILLGFLETYRNWQMNPATTVEGLLGGRVTCWPIFQNCHDLIWMQTLPHGYSQTVFFMGLFALMALAAWSLAVNRIAVAYGCILLLFIAKIYLTAQNYAYKANYDYYHTAFCIIFLFLPHKRFFGALSIALFYYLSTASKINPSWTLGMYFSAMKLGLPLFPNGSEPILTNLVIFMEMIMCWFLFSNRKWLQRSVFLFFCVFHLYSGTLVGYHYPSIVMPTLITFFGPHVATHRMAIPRDWRSLFGWSFVLVLFGLQMVGRVIPGDERLTLEGNFYGLYMFEANHQCYAEFLNTKGETLHEGYNITARNRCDPWEYLTRAQTRFCRPEVEKVRFRMIHSINGGPFYRIVDAPDLCALRYKPFEHNDWIRDHHTAPIVGRPLKNYYW